jgi:hypothetical protein
LVEELENRKYKFSEHGHYIMKKISVEDLYKANKKGVKEIKEKLDDLKIYLAVASDLGETYIRIRRPLG